MNNVRHWHIAANFFVGNQSRWLDDFINDENLTFSKIPAIQSENWHRRGSKTGLRQWHHHFRHAWRALRGRPDGVITCFPQLALCLSILKLVGVGRPYVVAHNFNLGSTTDKWKGQLAGLALRGVDRFLVHSPVEVERYPRWLNIPADRFQFVPLQRGSIKISRLEDKNDPFIIAMGSAHRDYKSLITAVANLSIRTIIVTKKDFIDQLPKPENVEFMSDLSQQECLELLARARLSVTPISNLESASGQVTFIDAMRIGIPVLVTRCPGTAGYIEDGVTGVLMEPFDPDDIRAKIYSLWIDGETRQKIAAAGRQFAETKLSDEGAAQTLREILLNF